MERQFRELPNVRCPKRSMVVYLYQETMSIGVAFSALLSPFNSLVLCPSSEVELEFELELSAAKEWSR